MEKVLYVVFLLIKGIIYFPIAEFLHVYNNFCFLFFHFNDIFLTWVTSVSPILSTDRSGW